MNATLNPTKTEITRKIVDEVELAIKTSNNIFATKAGFLAAGLPAPFPISFTKMSKILYAKKVGKTQFYKDYAYNLLNPEEESESE